MPSTNTPAAVALVAPVLLGMLAAVLFVGAELAGVTPPLAASPPRNIAEAAGTGSAPDVWRFLAQGQDPLAVYDVRPHIISSSIAKATAGEAAIWSRRLELVQFLDQRGVLGDAGTRADLFCLAAELRTDDIEKHLASEAPAFCHGSAVERIASRSK